MTGRLPGTSVAISVIVVSPSYGFKCVAQLTDASAGVDQALIVDK